MGLGFLPPAEALALADEHDLALELDLDLEPEMALAPPPSWLTFVSQSGMSSTATGVGRTTSIRKPLTVSAVAMMEAVPARTAVANPAAFTLATEGADEVHVGILPLTELPRESVSAAEKVTVSPMMISVSRDELTAMDAAA